MVYVTTLILVMVVILLNLSARCPPQLYAEKVQGVGGVRFNGYHEFTD